jgi:hypothetical protein
MHDSQRRKNRNVVWMTGIGITWLVITTCFCLGVYGLLRIFPMLVMALFPSHILTASRQIPTATIKATLSSAELSDLFPGELDENEVQYASNAIQIMAECRQAAEMFTLIIDKTQNMEKPLPPETRGKLVNSAGGFSEQCVTLGNILDPPPKRFLVFDGYMKKAAQEVRSMEDYIRQYGRSGSKEKYDEGLKRYSLFQENMDAGNKALKDLFKQPTSGSESGSRSPQDK